MARIAIRSGVVNPVTAPADLSWLALPNGWKAGDGPGVVFAHGRSGDATQGRQNPWQHVGALLDAGIVVLGLDLTGPLAYGHPSAVKTFDEGVSYLLSTVGVAGTKVGAMAWSMGGATAANWMIRNPSKLAVAQLWSPLLDIDWAANTGSPYAAPYGSSWVVTTAIAAAPTEVSTAYTNVGPGAGTATTTTATAVTVPAVGGAGVTVPLTTAINIGDPATKGSDARSSRVLIGGTACTYTGVAGNSLLGVVSTTGSTVVTIAGNTVVSTTYAQNVPGYDPMKRRADFAAVTAPVQIIHASDDVTIPPSASDYFDAGAPANFTMRAKPLGGHSGQFVNVPALETAALFATASYT